MRNKLLSSYRLVQALSFDVAIGAVLLSAFIAKVFVIAVPILVYIELALAVWCIYTWDHLMDIKVKKGPQIFRRQFHQKHAKKLLLALLICLIIGASLVFFLPVNTLYMGVAISIFVLLYFFVIHFFPAFYHKETFIAVLYGMGVFLGPISCMTEFPEGEITSYLFFTILIAFTNLMIFSEFEKEEDQQSGYPSFAIKLGKKAGTFISMVLILQFAALIIFFAFSFISAEVFYCFISMISVLGLVYFGRKISVRNEYYRILGDGIFFIPLFFLG